MNSRNPLVSVILPAYNVAPYISETLRSLTEQSLNELEVIIVEDGSTDGTRKIVQKAEEIPNVRVIYHQGNQGLAAARNTGIAAAKARYIAFIDGDDLAQPDMYLRMVTAAQEERAEIVTCGYSTFKGAETPTPAPHRLPVGRRLAGGEKSSILKRAHREKVYWYSQLAMYSRDLIEREGLRFDPAVLLGEDSVFNAQAFHKARAIYSVPERLYLIRQRPESMTNHGNPDWNRRISVQYQALKSFYQAESLWAVAAEDYYQYVLEFQLPQAILNSRVIATERQQLVELLGNLRDHDWVTDALKHNDAWRGLSLKRTFVAKLMKYRLLAIIARIYPPNNVTTSSPKPHR